MSADTASSSSVQPQFTLADCTLDICPVSTSFYQYRIDLAPNAAFVAVFSLSLLSFLVVLALTQSRWWWRRRGGHGMNSSDVGFTVAMGLGLICEILGYAGRIASWRNQWDENGFLMQICCLTIGPAFLAAGVYLCIRRIVLAFGPENSRIPPQYYTRIVRVSPSRLVFLAMKAPME